MRLEFYQVEDLKKEIREIVGKYLDLNSYRIFFFGSRVAGQGDKHSDIDVGIEGPKEIPSTFLFPVYLKNNLTITQYLE